MPAAAKQAAFALRVVLRGVAQQRVTQPIAENRAALALTVV